MFTSQKHQSMSGKPALATHKKKENEAKKLRNKPKGTKVSSTEVLTISKSNDKNIIESSNYLKRMCAYVIKTQRCVTLISV